MTQERYRVVSLWARWAMAVADGIKTIETREWAIDPGPIVIHAGKQLDGDMPGRVEPFPSVHYVPPGTICALAWIAKCRPLVPEDRSRALVYRPGLYAWELEHISRLAPFPFIGPRKLGYIDSAIVIEALHRLNPPHYQDRE